MEVLNLFRKRNIPVSFTDFPEHNVDRTLFDSSRYNQIVQYGLSKSPINIIHAASIHYKGRFRNSKFLRLSNSFLDIVKSIGEYGDGKLYLKSTENAELQKGSSEVIAVGLCIELTSELFNINKNRINLIEDTKKRCDFRFAKNSREYVIESKGRKGSTVNARKDIFSKKRHYPNHIPKYGVISSLPRDQNHVTIDLIDPEFEPKYLSRKEEIQGLLSYYAKLSYITGFWRMGDLLSERALALGKEATLEQFEGKELQYDNILKFGNAIEISIGDYHSQVFFPRDGSFGFKQVFDGEIAFFAMEKKLIEILNMQNYSSLAEYNMHYAEDINVNNSFVSIGNDGSSLIIARPEIISQYI